QTAASDPATIAKTSTPVADNKLGQPVSSDQIGSSDRCKLPTSSPTKSAIGAAMTRACGANLTPRRVKSQTITRTIAAAKNAGKINSVSALRKSDHGSAGMAYLGGV